MAEYDDLAVGHAILERNIVARDALLDCLFEMVAERRGERARAFPRPLGVMLVQRSLITEQQLRDILAERLTPGKKPERMAQVPLGELLLGLGYARGEQIRLALDTQQASRKSGAPRPRLGEILVERGFVTAEQVARALAYQSKEIYRCTRCALRVNLSNPRLDEDHECQVCGGKLVPAEPGKLDVHDSVVMSPGDVTPRPASASASGTDSTWETDSGFLPVVDPHLMEIDRAVDIYVRQKGIARRDTLREARRVQMEIGRYGLSVPLLDVLRRTSAVSGQQGQMLEKVDFADIVRQPSWKEMEIPGYKVKERIAFGGYATIYTAQPVFGQNTVALKMLRHERADDQAIARLKREANLLRKLDHPGIIKGVEYGHKEGTHFIVMEYFPAMSLGQAIAESRGFAPRLAVAILRQIGDALDYLCREGWIHRDVKPDNVLIDPHDKTKLCDLGFAIEIPRGDKKTTAVGTVGYASPEQMRGEADVGIGTDIYSLGLTFYAMLAGFEPFHGASSQVMVSEFVEGGLPPPDLFKVKAPPPVVDLVRRMTNRDRERRIPSYKDLATAIDGLGL